MLERKAKSYLALQRNEEALSQFRNTIKALDDCKLPVEKKLKMQTDIQVMLRVMSKSVNNSDGNKHPAVSCEQRQGTYTNRKAIL